MASSRRSFLEDMVKACVGASILPAALTYSRRWKYSSRTYTLIAPVYVLNSFWAAKHNEITPGRFIEVDSEEDIINRVCDYDKFYKETIFYKKNEQGFFTKIV